MRNLLNNPKVVGALCVIALITVYFRLFDSKPKIEPPAETDEAHVVAEKETASNSSPSPQPAMASPSDLPQASPITVGWSESLDRDPFHVVRDSRSSEDSEDDTEYGFEKGERKLAAARALRLQAVFLDGSNRMAMINRQLVKEGERIEGYVVRHIQREAVRLQGQEDEKVLVFGSATTDGSSES